MSKELAMEKTKLPLGWKLKTIADVTKIVAGGTPKTGTKEFWDGEIAWITPADLGKLKTREVSLTRRTITDIGLQKSSAKLFPENSVILSSRAPIGHLAINSVPMSTNQGCRGIVPKEDLNTIYLYYFLKGNISLLNDLGTGATFKELSTRALGSVLIPLPPLPQQKQIVAILDKAFAAIDTAKANAEQNLLNAKELFESYLQNVFENKGDDWEEKTLEQIADVFGRGKSKHRPRNDKKLYGGDYPFIQTGDIRNSEHFITDYTQTYNDLGLAQSRLWPTGTICITIAANIAETGILSFDACFPDSVIGVVVDKEQANIDYVEYLLQFYKVNIQSLSQGSAQENINLGTFKDKLFPFAPLHEQKEIVSKLDALSLDCKKLEAIYTQKIDDLEEMKKSVLQKAFSGQLTTTN